MTLEAQAQKLVAGLVRVAVMAPTDAPPDERSTLPPPHRQVLLLLGRRDREFRLSDLAAELGSSVAATMAIVSPLVAEGLVEMRPAPSYAAHDMRIAATERGLALTPAPSNWAENVLGTRRGPRRAHPGAPAADRHHQDHAAAAGGPHPREPHVPVVPLLRRLPPPRHRCAASLLVRRRPVRLPRVTTATAPTTFPAGRRRAPGERHGRALRAAEVLLCCG